MENRPYQNPDSPIYRNDYLNNMGYRGDSAGKADQRGLLRDYGPEPYVTNITDATLRNNYYRMALWTGQHLQLTLMSIRVGGDIGLEMHPDVDQFIRLEQGEGIAMMGSTRDNLNYRRSVYDDYVIFVPAGTWHNLVNTGRVPIKLYSIYAPPNHPHGTVQRTKEDSEH